MKFLIMTGSIYPNVGNNANLIGKLIPDLLENGHEVSVFSSSFGADKNKLPDSFDDCLIYWSLDDKKSFKRRFVYPAVSKLKDPHGFSDYVQVQIYLEELKRIRDVYPYDAVISTSEPYPMAVAASTLRNIKRILYLMDPPALISRGHNTKYRTNTLKKTIQTQDIVISTPFIFKELKKYGIELNDAKCLEAGFPMIQDHSDYSVYRQSGKIKLLFSGWLYSDIRSPRYFLDIVSRLDKRFQITFMGKECDRLKEKFSVESRAEIITFPQQPYETALQALADADILINIGNSVPVHMPSKTLEYINTGKPIVNFYKFDDCPTLYYTKRYPLALNLYEGDKDIDDVANTFSQFCESVIGQVAERNHILEEYKDCTPGYITNMILDALGK